MLEVCVDKLEGLRIAIDAGAQQIELSERLSVGGVTPSMELVRQARSELADSLIVLIRCREGDFQYSEDELECMLDQACQAVRIGADGVAVGACLPDRSLDWDFLERMHARIQRVSDAACLVVHRVFDEVPDPKHSIERLISLGYQRILTSGGRAVAVDSLDSLKDWQSQASDRLEILPAGGIHSWNAERILQETGCRQLHGSFTKTAAGVTSPLPHPDEIKIVREILDARLKFLSEE